jgi:hypothetical protein
MILLNNGKENMLVEAFLKGCLPNIKAYIDMQRVLGIAPKSFQKSSGHGEVGSSNNKA